MPALTTQGRQSEVRAAVREQSALENEDITWILMGCGLRISRLGSHGIRATKQHRNHCFECTGWPLERQHRPHPSCQCAQRTLVHHQALSAQLHHVMSRDHIYHEMSAQGDMIGISTV